MIPAYMLLMAVGVLIINLALLTLLLLRAPESVIKKGSREGSFTRTFVRVMAFSLFGIQAVILISLFKGARRLLL